MMTMSWIGAVHDMWKLREEGRRGERSRGGRGRTARRGQSRSREPQRRRRGDAQACAEVDAADVGADVVDEAAVGDDRARLARQDESLAVQRRDEGRSREDARAGRVLEERVQTQRRDDLHAPQAEAQADADADGLRLVAGNAAVGVVGVRAERDEGARDERRRDEEAVRDDLERAGRPEGPEELCAGEQRSALRRLERRRRGRTVSEMASAMPTLRLPSPDPPNRLPNDHHALRIADGW